jgi:hypothetical protein
VPQPRSRSARWLIGRFLAMSVLVVGTSLPAQATSDPPQRASNPRFINASAHDVSPPLSVLAARYQVPADAGEEDEIRTERGEPPVDTGFAGDGAVQTVTPSVTIPSATSFEGLRNTDNPFRADGTQILVNPPDPIGDVGPHNYVEMVNLVFAVYDRSGTMQLGPVPLGALWDGFAIPDCTDLSGDPVVLYDQLADRWILSQFTTSGLVDPTLPFWNCVAISTTGDPTGSYYRYAFETGHLNFFPDYPKYGIWTDTYVITTREFGPTVEYGIGVYGLEKNKMINGQAARAVDFFIDGNDPDLLPLVGDGLLPADIDGKQKPMLDTAMPLVGTQDDGGGYGGTFDALNIWDFRVKWRSTPVATLSLAAQLPVASFDSIFPCAPTARDCLPQPGITNTAQYLDILSYRQRPTWRLAYRNFKTYEALVTNQSVEALPGIAGVRWYEIRRSTAGAYSLFQQGTYAPNDGVHRWMGSIAQDKKGDMALGYSVVNATDVYPGIRYTGRLSGDAAGQMTLGEGTVINGTGVQTTTNSRWGDYTSMNIDPTDDCTFWYVNEYYQTTDTTLLRNWQTRIASFKLPGC